jgi:tetratricopeptide (TPR) repeat protein
MGIFSNFWNWLKDRDNREIVGLLVIVIFGVIGGGWYLYLHLSKPPVSESKPTSSGIQFGDIKAERDVKINITQQQTSKDLLCKMDELQAELRRSSPEQRASLERDLAVITKKFENLQQAYEEQKAKRAEAYKALTDFKRDFGPEQVRQAQKALAQGNTETAETLLHKALEMSTSQAAEAAYLLGVLAESRIDYRNAEEYYAKAVQLQPDNPLYLNALGNLQRTLGNYQEAQQHLEKSLHIREKSLGPDHPDVANSLNNLAELYRKQGKFDKANPLFQRALKIREKTLGPDHPSVANSLNNLAELYRNQGKYEKAEPLFRQALKINEQALGPEHPDVANSLNNLAVLFRDQGKFDKAEPLFQRALKIREKGLGPDHPSVANSLNNLAELYWDQGNYGKAEPLLHRALKIYEKALGPDHPTLAIKLNNLAKLNYLQRKYTKAEPIFQNAIKIFEKSSPIYLCHSCFAKCLENYAALLRKMERDTEAVPLEARAQAIREKGAGKSQ